MRDGVRHSEVRADHDGAVRDSLPTSEGRQRSGGLKATYRLIGWPREGHLATAMLYAKPWSSSRRSAKIIAEDVVRGNNRV